MGWLFAVHVPCAEYDRASRRPKADAADGCHVQSARRRLPLGRRDAEYAAWRFVVILGPGQRGLASVVACRSVGAGTIIVTGIAADANKLALARKFGADHTIDVDNEDAVARVKELTNGHGADIVVDVSSYATKPVADALSMVRTGGTVGTAGVKGFRAVDNFVSDLVVMKEINIKGAIGVTSSGYKAAIRLIESGRVPLELMHTHDFALEDAALAIRTLAGRCPAPNRSTRA